MARPEAPLEGSDQDLLEFAAGLRQLRRQAGSPSYRRLSTRAHYSPSALSQAASGKSLPTLAVTQAFVVACGGDPAEWEQRWRALARAAATLPATPGQPAAAADAAEPVYQDDGSPDPPLLRRLRRRWMLAGAGGAVATVGVVSMIAWAPWARTGGANSRADGRSAAEAGVCTLHASGNDGNLEPVQDCSDPKQAGCGTGAVTLGAVDVHVPSDQYSGQIELRYSPTCRSAWARFTAAPGWNPGPRMQITVITARPADQRSASFTVEFSGPAVIGDMLMTAPGCVMAEIVMRQDADKSPVASTDCLTPGVLASVSPSPVSPAPSGA